MNFSIYLLRGLPPHLNCVATLSCIIEKSEIAAELLLIPLKLITFTWNLQTCFFWLTVYMGKSSDGLKKPIMRLPWWHAAADRSRCNKQQLLVTALVKHMQWKIWDDDAVYADIGDYQLRNPPGFFLGLFLCHSLLLKCCSFQREHGSEVSEFASDFSEVGDQKMYVRHCW